MRIQHDKNGVFQSIEHIFTQNQRTSGSREERAIYFFACFLDRLSRGGFVGQFLCWDREQDIEPEIVSMRKGRE